MRYDIIEKTLTELDANLVWNKHDKLLSQDQKKKIGAAMLAAWGFGYNVATRGDSKFGRESTTSQGANSKYSRNMGGHPTRDFFKTLLTKKQQKGQNQAPVGNNRQLEFMSPHYPFEKDKIFQIAFKSWQDENDGLKQSHASSTQKLATNVQLVKPEVDETASYGQDVYHQAMRQRRLVLNEVEKHQGNKEHFFVPKGGYPCVLVNYSLWAQQKQALTASDFPHIDDKQTEKLNKAVADFSLSFLSGTINLASQKFYNKSHDFIAMQPQSSFGTLRPSVTDAGPWVRVSPGLTPRNYGSDVLPKGIELFHSQELFGKDFTDAVVKMRNIIKQKLPSSVNTREGQEALNNIINFFGSNRVRLAISEAVSEGVSPQLIVNRMLNFIDKTKDKTGQPHLSGLIWNVKKFTQEMARFTKKLTGSRSKAPNIALLKDFASGSENAMSAPPVLKVALQTIQQKLKPALETSPFNDIFKRYCKLLESDEISTLDFSEAALHIENQIRLLRLDKLVKEAGANSESEPSTQDKYRQENGQLKAPPANDQAVSVGVQRRTRSDSLSGHQYQKQTGKPNYFGLPFQSGSQAISAAVQAANGYEISRVKVEDDMYFEITAKTLKDMQRLKHLSGQQPNDNFSHLLHVMDLSPMPPEHQFDQSHDLLIKDATDGTLKNHQGQAYAPSVLLVDITSADPEAYQKLVSKFEQKADTDEGPKMLVLFSSNNKLGLGTDVVSFGELRVFRKPKLGDKNTFMPEFEDRLQTLYEQKYQTHTVESWLELLDDLSSRRKLEAHIYAKGREFQPQLETLPEDVPQQEDEQDQGIEVTEQGVQAADSSVRELDEGEMLDQADAHNH